MGWQSAKYASRGRRLAEKQAEVEEYSVVEGNWLGKMLKTLSQVASVNFDTDKTAHDRQEVLKAYKEFITCSQFANVAKKDKPFSALVAFGNIFLNYAEEMNDLRGFADFILSEEAATNSATRSSSSNSDSTRAQSIAPRSLLRAPRDNLSSVLFAPATAESLDARLLLDCEPANQYYAPMSSSSFFSDPSRPKPVIAPHFLLSIATPRKGATLKSKAGLSVSALGAPRLPLPGAASLQSPVASFGAEAVAARKRRAVDEKGDHRANRPVATPIDKRKTAFDENKGDTRARQAVATPIDRNKTAVEGNTRARQAVATPHKTAVEGDPRAGRAVATPRRKTAIDEEGDPRASQAMTPRKREVKCASAGKTPPLLLCTSTPSKMTTKTPVKATKKQSTMTSTPSEATKSPLPITGTSLKTLLKVLKTPSKMVKTPLKKVASSVKSAGRAAAGADAARAAGAAATTAKRELSLDDAVFKENDQQPVMKKPERSLDEAAFTADDDEPLLKKPRMMQHVRLNEYGLEDETTDEEEEIKVVENIRLNEFGFEEEAADSEDEEKEEVKNVRLNAFGLEEEAADEDEEKEKEKEEERELPKEKEKEKEEEKKECIEEWAANLLHLTPACFICDKPCENGYQLSNHLYHCHKGLCREHYVFECRGCNQRFRSFGGMRGHVAYAMRKMQIKCKDQVIYLGEENKAAAKESARAGPQRAKQEEMIGVVKEEDQTSP